MKIKQFKELYDEKCICIVGAGKLGKGDAYIFLRTMIPQVELCYYDNNIEPGSNVVDDIYAVSLSEVVEKKMVCCIAVESRAIYEKLSTQLKVVLNEKLYWLNTNSILKLCNELMYEEKYVASINAFFKQREYEVQIETTSFCNAKCEFCPNSSLKREKNIMSDDIFQQILDRIQKEEINVTVFILHLNGEPLLDKTIFEKIEMIKRKFPKVKVRFTTNFSLANKEVVSQLLCSKLDEITISLNAITSEEYRKIMSLDYNTTLTNLEYFIREKERVESKMKVNFSIVKTKHNENQVSEFIEEYSGFGKVRVMELGNWVDEGQEIEQCDGNDDKMLCPILYKTINILSNGDYALCCFDAEGIIGLNVRDVTIADAWKSAVFKSIRKYHVKNGKNNKECIGCSF